MAAFCRLSAVLTGDVVDLGATGSMQTMFKVSKRAIVASKGATVDLLERHGIMTETRNTGHVLFYFRTLFGSMLHWWNA